jgi:hypothetical protein
MIGTYRDQPAAGHQGMIIGIEQLRVVRELWLDLVLLWTFRGSAGAYAINWRRAAQNCVISYEGGEPAHKAHNQQGLKTPTRSASNMASTLTSAEPRFSMQHDDRRDGQP